MTPKIVDVRTNNDWTMIVTFADDKIKKFDCNYLKKLGQFKIISDLEKFHKVIIDDLGGIGWDIDDSIDSTIIWSNRIDVCKDVIYQDGVEVK